jgi:hypothetical protein
MTDDNIPSGIKPAEVAVYFADKLAVMQRRAENAEAEVARLNEIIATIDRCERLANALCEDGDPDALRDEDEDSLVECEVLIMKTLAAWRKQQPAPDAPAPPKLERTWNAPIVGPGNSLSPKDGKAGDADICECHHEHAWHCIDELGKPWCLKCAGAGRYHVYKEAGRR